MDEVFTKMDHIGIVVRDLDTGIKHFEALGYGPFSEFPASVFDALEQKTIRGKPYDYKMRAAMADAGSGVRIEILQPIKGRHPLMEDFLKKHGEGVNHVGYKVEDLEGEVDRMVKKGYKMVSSARHPSMGAAYYFETDKVGGLLIEIVRTKH